MYRLTVYDDAEHDTVVEETWFRLLVHLHCYCIDNDLQYYSYCKE